MDLREALELLRDDGGVREWNQRRISGEGIASILRLSAAFVTQCFEREREAN